MRMTLFILQDLSAKNKCLPLTSQKLSRKVLKSARQGLRANNKRKEKSGIKHRSQNWRELTPKQTMKDPKHQKGKEKKTHRY